MSSCEVAELPPLNHCLALVPAYVDVADSRSVELDVLASSAFFNSSYRTVVMSLDTIVAMCHKTFHMHGIYIQGLY